MTRTAKKIRSVLFYQMVWIALTLVVITGGVIVAASFMVTHSLEKSLKREANELAAEIAASLKEAVWTMDETFLAEHLASLNWASLGVAQIKVTTQFGDPIFIGPCRVESAPVFGKAEVQYQGERIGYVIVGKSRQRIARMKKMINRVTLIVLLAALATLFLACTIGLKMSIIVPLKRTVDGLRRIAGGEYEFRLGEDGGKEIHAINAAVNTMASEIASRQKLLADEVETRRKTEEQLQELNRNLEARVGERTERLRSMAMMLATAQDQEQKRIAEGLHDEVAQLVAAARMKINQVKGLQEGCKTCGRAVAEADEMIRQAYDQIRLLSFELASSHLYQRGLARSLELLCKGMSERYDVSFNLTCSGSEQPAVDQASGAVLFKSARELMFNVVKHAGVREAIVNLNFEKDQVTLTIEDRGRGFAPEDLDLERGKGLGLFSIRERLRDIEGNLDIDSQPGHLTRITLSIPICEKGCGDDA